RPELLFEPRSVQPPNVFCCDHEQLSSAGRNELGSTAQNASLHHVFVTVVARPHLEDRHVIPLYHVCINAPVQRTRTDFIVAGAGVAGLRAAIELARSGRVLVIAKDSLRESSSEYAQGGIAVALSDDDEVGLHEQDTLAAGAGLCDREAVHTLAEEGPAAIEQLIEWGAE